ncbi:MAG: hypothetical protein ACE14M_07520 [Terriglobales bacterium]
MKLGNLRRTRNAGGERGYILLTLVLFSVLMLIALATEAPNMAAQARHEREDELIHRGVQYARAVKRYYRKFGAYPASLEQLEETNKMRFLRRRYLDPFTGKPFRAVRYGDPDLPSTLMSAAPVLPGASTIGSPLGTPLGAGSQVSTSAPVATFSGSGGSLTAGTSSAGSRSYSSGSQGASSAGSTTTATTASTESGGVSGTTVGGGPILGVASTSEKEGFHEFNHKRQYSQWMFIYDPTADPKNLITGPYNGPPAFTPVNNPISIFSAAGRGEGESGGGRTGGMQGGGAPDRGGRGAGPGNVRGR